MRKLIWILCLAVAYCGVAVADEGHHHEELTQDQLGTVHFPVSCAPDVQKSFEKEFVNTHFAGEHLADWQGFMEGAINTGEDAAEKI